MSVQREAGLPFLDEPTHRNASDVRIHINAVYTFAIQRRSIQFRFVGRNMKQEYSVT